MKIWSQFKKCMLYKNIADDDDFLMIPSLKGIECTKKFYIVYNCMIILFQLQVIEVLAV